MGKFVLMQVYDGFSKSIITPARVVKDDHFDSIGEVFYWATRTKGLTALTATCFVDKYNNMYSTEMRQP